MGELFFTSLLFYLLAVGANGAPKSTCDDSNCVLPNCRCFSPTIPGGLAAKDTPQLVTLTFDDAVTGINFDQFYSKTLFNRQNPNKCNISATFFSTHEYNDYKRTNILYRQGHEIALHTISHQPGIDYWSTASVEQLEEEFIGQRDILQKFGLIPADAMKGMRAPFLQNAGDNTYKMMAKHGITWDCSWPTQQNMPNDIPWPYTLDFPSPQECPIPPCPSSTFPGSWVVPMIDWMDENDVLCSMVDTCTYLSDKKKLLEFMKLNFHRHYDGNRAPFPFYIHAAWFSALPMRFEVYNEFLDYLGTLKDVYIVSVSQMLEWVKNPTPLSKMQDFYKCWQIPENKCHPISCHLIREDNGEDRYMSSCSPCPAVYPWLGNPDGSGPVTTANPE